MHVTAMARGGCPQLHCISVTSAALPRAFDRGRLLLLYAASSPGEVGGLCKRRCSMSAPELHHFGCHAPLLLLACAKSSGGAWGYRVFYQPCVVPTRYGTCSGGWRNMRLAHATDTTPSCRLMSMCPACSCLLNSPLHQQQAACMALYRKEQLRCSRKEIAAVPCPMLHPAQHFKPQPDQTKHLTLALSPRYTCYTCLQCMA